MDSSVSAKDEIWFLRVCHHVSNAVYTNTKTAHPAGKIERKIFDRLGNVIRMDHRRAARKAFYGKPESRRGEAENERAGRWQE